MRLPMPVLAALLLAACQSAPAPFTGTTYGEAPTLTEATPVAAILDRPEDYLGQRVLIEGRVVDVCDRMGCWMDVVAGEDGRVIQVKVDDGVIVFPVEAKGRLARVEGTVEKLELTHDQALEAARHRAEEQGVEPDLTEVTGPRTTYRIRGTGAIIADA